MSTRNCKVRVLEGILMLDCDEFDPHSFSHRPTHREVEISFAQLGEAIYGPRGGFQHAELKDSRTGKVVWTFYRGHRQMHEDVEVVLNNYRGQVSA